MQDNWTRNGVNVALLGRENSDGGREDCGRLAGNWASIPTSSKTSYRFDAYLLETWLHNSL